MPYYHVSSLYYCFPIKSSMSSILTFQNQKIYPRKFSTAAHIFFFLFTKLHSIKKSLSYVIYLSLFLFVESTLI